jgi:hypothetical protein
VSLEDEGGRAKGGREDKEKGEEKGELDTTNVARDRHLSPS